MTHIDFGNLLAELGEALGMEVAFDDAGVCELVVHESFGVSPMKSEEDGTLTVFCSLGADLPDPVDYPLVPDLREVNFGAASGASCAVERDPEAGALEARQTFTTSMLEAEPIAELFVQFVQSRIALAEIVAEYFADGLRLLVPSRHGTPTSAPARPSSRRAPATAATATTRPPTRPRSSTTTRLPRSRRSAPRRSRSSSSTSPPIPPWTSRRRTARSCSASRTTTRAASSARTSGRPASTPSPTSRPPSARWSSRRSTSSAPLPGTPRRRESPGNRMLPQGHSPIFLGRVLRHLDGIRAPLIAAIKQALPGGNAQKAVSIFLHQGSSRFVSFPQNHLPWPAGPGQEADVNAHALHGAEKPANRDKQSGP